MRSWIRCILLATAVAIAPATALATELQVSPTGIDVAAPGAASKISITNLGKDVINAQVRIFKWVQVDGENQLAADPRCGGKPTSHENSGRP